MPTRELVASGLVGFVVASYECAFCGGRVPPEEALSVGLNRPPAAGESPQLVVFSHVGCLSDRVTPYQREGFEEVWGSPA